MHMTLLLFLSTLKPFDGPPCPHNLCPPPCPPDCGGLVVIAPHFDRPTCIPICDVNGICWCEPEMPPGMVVTTEINRT